MTPEGPRHQSSNHTLSSAALGNTFSGEMSGVRFEAPDRGRQGILVHHDGTGDAEPHTVRLPGIAGRYQRGSGIVYLLPTEWGDLYHADAVEVAKGEAWTRIGEDDAAEWSRTSLHRRIWLYVAHECWPITSPSPRVTEGRPPLAPELAPVTENLPAAREAWGALAQRLTPAGRLIVGLALTAPWIDRFGATSSVVSLWGEAGEGKSLLARVCAALYGDPEDGAGLFGTFNSSGQGLTAHAQDLAHLPIILDEAQSATADVEPQLIALAMGAQRKRSSRSGSAVRSAARWGGLVIVTGNAPLDLQHEMFDRRLLDVQVSDLWTGAPSAEDWLARAEWWAEVARALPTLAGWPWHDFTRRFEPGTPSAQDVLTGAHRIPMPGAGNLGMLGRLGVFGCQWLTEWTGADWTTGTWDAAAHLIADRAEAAHDPARDAARQLIDGYVTAPGLWTKLTDAREARGFPADDLRHRATCGIDHDHDAEGCNWLNVYPSVFRELVDMPLPRLGRTPFRRALYTNDGTDHLMRKLRQGETRTRVVTVCMGALDALAEPVEALTIPEELVPETMPLLNSAQQAPQRPASPAPRSSAPLTLIAPEEGREDPEETAPVVRVFAHSDDPDLGAALDRAAAEGTTDLIGPQQWEPSTAAGWDARGWTGQGSGNMHREDGGAVVRVWRIPTGRTTPAEYAEALRTFTEGTGLEFLTVPTLGHRLVIDHDGGKRPRWQLPDEQAEVWTPGEILHPRQWGDRHAEAAQYDRNKSYLSAITQANIAPLFYGEQFEHYGDSAPVDRSLAGMYRIIVPEWSSPLPAPHATEEPGAEVWTTPEVMRLYAELGIHPVIREAWLAPAHKVGHVHALAEQCKTWLAEYADSPAQMIPKAIYQSFAGSITSEHFKGQRYRLYRPDWGNSIADNSWCNVLRRVYKIHAADSRFVPVRVNVDAIYFPPDLPEPPGLPLGDGLGQFKREG